MFRLGASGRLAAHAILYAPAPMGSLGLKYGLMSNGEACGGKVPHPLETGKGCHGPHMGTSWWVNRAQLANHSAWTRPYAWQRFWRRSRVLGPHAVLNHAPLRWRGWRLWLADQYRPANPVAADDEGSAEANAAPTVWFGIPEWRLGGIYAPANAQFQTRAFALPAAPLAVNVDTAWQVPAAQCDPLNELCQAYVMAALLDARTGAVIPGYEAANNTVIRGIDGTAIELRWGNDNTTTAALDAGREVRLRFTFRDAVLYSVGTVSS